MARPDAVAVAASNIALLDSGDHDREPGRVHEATDVIPLRGAIPVIELQDDGIRLPAVDAGVRLQKFRHKAPCRTVRRLQRPPPAQIRREVLAVVPLSVLAEAGTAIRAQRPALLVLHGKLAERLRD